MVYKDYFLHPVETSHRRYEAIRAVLIEEEPMKEVAERFAISYGTVRNWVSEFRHQRDADQSPPFSSRHRVDAPRPTHLLTTIWIPMSKWPMFERCHWRPDVG